jgi:hypothetical protein
MKHKELVKTALDRLPPSADAVASPDHPLLLHGPDLIASFRGSLTAYFVSTRGAAQVSNSLPKVMLSRLALPPTTACVLILDESIDLDDRYSPFFEDIIAVGRRRSRVPAGRRPFSDSLEAIEAVRPFHHERFADTWTATIRQRGVRRRQLPGEATSALMVKSALQPGKFMDFHQGQYFFVPPETIDRRGLRTSLSGAINAAVTGDYGLAAGQHGFRNAMELINSRDAHLARHSGLVPALTQTRVFDTQKPLRAAAFAGYAIKIRAYNAS